VPGGRLHVGAVGRVGSSSSSNLVKSVNEFTGPFTSQDAVQ